jgi:UDP-N-acetyl-D-glucosamine dehydrogenase
MKLHNDLEVAVFGQGYVGLPLAISLVKAGYKVVGFDLDLERINQIKVGLSPILDISDSDIQDLFNSQNYIATCELNDCKKSTVKIVCVPTPLTNDNNPDFYFVTKATELIGSIMNDKDIVIIESTISIGSTRNLILDLLNETARNKSVSFDLVYSPERIDPGSRNWNLNNTPKLISGLNEESVHRGCQIYSKFIEDLVICSSFEVAEAAKLLENTFRFVNISFINELSMLLRKVNIDVLEVIQAAATKPYGFMPFFPSMGVGGHCIPVDPIYLTSFANDIGFQMQSVNTAVQINNTLPDYFAKLASDFLGGLKNKKILIVGIAFKKNISDTRESSSIKLLEKLRKLGANVDWHDDLVESWNGEKTSEISDNYELLVLSTPHDYLEFSNIRNVPVLDTRGFIS